MFNFSNTIQFQDKINDVFTIGEILVDMISDDYDTNFNSNKYSRFFGGSPANITMNIKSIYYNDIDKLNINHLKNNNIDTNLINSVNHSTSMVLVTKSKETPLPIFYRSADYNLEYNSDIDSTLKNSKIVHFSCWPISQSKSRKMIERVIEEARKNNVLIGFDPNYHEMIWEEGHDGIEYIKNLENNVNKFIECGAKLVIMTLGKYGAIVSDGTKTIKFNTLATEVIDTTGAGDAFWGGFYTAITSNYTLKEALNIGFATSAFKLKHVGAIAKLPS